MTAPGKTDFGLKVFKIVNYRNEANPTILEYKKIDDADQKKIFNEELALLMLKYKRLRVKCGERVPGWSRSEGHLWYITKDKFGIMYFILVKETFEESYVFKLQNKIRTMIDFYYEELNSSDEKRSNEIRVQIEEKVQSFNNALSKDAPAGDLVSSDNSDWKAVSQEEKFVNLDGQEVDEQSIDPNDFFYLIDKRNSKVKILQISVCVGAFLTLVLGALDILVSIGRGK